tara:strand:- start:21040 stop:21267 length:228 start_codon:yes stop_codon:yes gene_type:complete
MQSKYWILAISFILTSCSSIKNIGNDTYKAKCNKLSFSCEEKIEKTCPNGYKILSTETEIDFGSANDVTYFKCKE